MRGGEQEGGKQNRSIIETLKCKIYMIVHTYSNSVWKIRQNKILTKWTKADYGENT